VNARQKIPTWCRSFALRPERPAANNGRVQKACRRALIAYDGQCSTSDALEFAYALRLHRGDRRRNEFPRAVRLAMRAIGAKRLKRSKTGRGRPWIWGMNMGKE